MEAKKSIRFEIQPNPKQISRLYAAYSCVACLLQNLSFHATVPTSFLPLPMLFLNA